MGCAGKKEAHHEMWQAPNIPVGVVTGTCMLYEKSDQ